MLQIIISKKEKYGEAARLIAEQCHKLFISVNIVDIENVKDMICSTSDIVFFLTNDTRVTHIAAQLSSEHIEVINGKYLTECWTKQRVQLRIQAAGISIPRFISEIVPRELNDEECINGIKFPIYIKSQYHACDVFKIKNSDEYTRVVAELDTSLCWYAEEAVDAPGRSFEKFYWIQGVCYGRDGRRSPRTDVAEAMNTIGKTFLFQAFSADFAMSKDAYWCIDVNVAPGFFGSKKAREAFVDFIKIYFEKRKKNFFEIYRASIDRRGGLKQFIDHKMKRSGGALIQRIQKRLPQGSRVVEVGAGTGALSALLASRGFVTTSIDRDTRMLSLIRASFETLGVSGTIRCDDAFEIGEIFAENEFECAISHGVMEHYNDHDIARLLHAQQRVAKKVVFVVPTAAMTHEYRHRGLGNERYLTTHEWRVMLKKMGFKVQAVYGFGSKETNVCILSERVWRWDRSARFLSHFAAFNEFWIEAR